MKISAKTEYACVAMLDLAVHHGSREPIQIRKIAERHGVPARFLVQILLQLKRAGLVSSVRGAAGGYRLRGSPEEISLGRIMEAMQGHAGGGSEKPCASSPDSPLVKVLLRAWEDVEAVRREMLGRITLAELVRRGQIESGSQSAG